MYGSCGFFQTRRGESTLTINDVPYPKDQVAALVSRTCCSPERHSDWDSKWCSKVVRQKHGDICRYMKYHIHDSAGKSGVSKDVDGFQQTLYSSITQVPLSTAN